MSKRTLCRSCKKPVYYVESITTGKMMPVDSQPNPERGNVAVFLSGGIIKFRVLKSFALDWMRRNYPHTVFESHFDTCPNADRHRKNAR